MTAGVSAAVEIPASADRTWQAVMDWARQGEWIPATQVTVTRGSGDAVGDQIVARTGIGRVGFDDTMEIVRWDPPRECEVRHLGRVVRGRGVFTVEALGADRSRFVWTENLDLPLGAVGAFAFRATRPLTHAALRAALRRVVKLVSD